MYTEKQLWIMKDLKRGVFYLNLNRCTNTYLLLVWDVEGDDEVGGVGLLVGEGTSEGQGVVVGLMQLLNSLSLSPR